MATQVTLARVACALKFSEKFLGNLVFANAFFTLVLRSRKRRATFQQLNHWSTSGPPNTLHPPNNGETSTTKLLLSVDPSLGTPASSTFIHTKMLPPARGQCARTETSALSPPLSLFCACLSGQHSLPLAEWVNLVLCFCDSLSLSLLPSLSHPPSPHFVVGFLREITQTSVFCLHLPSLVLDSGT